MSELTIQLPDSILASLDELSRQRRCTTEQVVRDMLEKALYLERLRQLRQELRPYARAAGFKTDEDVFKAIS